MNDKICSVINEIDETKNIMIHNIDLVIARGEKIDNLLVQSDNLVNDAKMFNKSTTKLKRLFFFKNLKLILIISVFIMIILLIILFAACYPNFSNCS